MITSTTKNEVGRSGVSNESQFTIRANGKAFRILSDGLYSDKITAIIRELSCNAYDSHIEAGHADRPFTIHVPNKLEPWFSIRDYGIGLSHEEVMHLYTTYFESTKTNSNDYIGCLGLGSKSPFSYVDSFNVISYQDGVKRIYNAFMNEEGVPSIAAMGETETGDVNGLEVKFAVKETDIYSFVDRVPSIFSFYKVKPELIGNSGIKIREYDYIMEGKDWGIPTNQTGSWAIMGNVAYPLDDFNVDLNDDQRSVLYSGLHIRFDLGELEPSASRESLSYTKATVANIKAKLNAIIDEIRTEASKMIEDAPTLWDARVMAWELLQGRASRLKKIFGGNSIFQYDGKSLSSGYVLLTGSTTDFNGSYRVECFSKRSWGTTVRKESVTTMQSSKGDKYFWKDIKRGSDVRCKSLFEDNPELDHVYLVTNIGRDKDGKDCDGIAHFKEMTGMTDAHIKPVSDIDYTPEKSGGRGTNSSKNSRKVLVYGWNNDLSSWAKTGCGDHWKSEKVDFNQGGIYVSIDRYKVDGNYNPKSYITEMKNSLLHLRIDISGRQIVGVKSAKVQEFVDAKNWVSLADYRASQYRKYIEKANMTEVFFYRKVQAELNSIFSYDRRDTYKSICKMSEGLDDDIDAILKYSKMTNNAVRLSSKASDVAYGLLKHAELVDKDKVSELVKTISGHLTSLQEKYPLFQRVDSYRTVIEDWEDYVRGMNLLIEQRGKGKGKVELKKVEENACAA